VATCWTGNSEQRLVLRCRSRLLLQCCINSRISQWLLFCHWNLGLRYGGGQSGLRSQGRFLYGESWLRVSGDVEESDVPVLLSGAPNID